MANKQTVDSPLYLIRINKNCKITQNINCIKLISMKLFMTLPPFAISLADTKRNSNLTLTGAIELRFKQIKIDLIN